jgi:hypothetical protein
VRYCGPFEVIERICPVAYMLALPVSMRIHDVFHMSLLKRYMCNPNHVIDWIVIHMEHNGNLQEESMRILDRKVKVLGNKSIDLIKVQWTCYGSENTTWEHKEAMQEEYP